MPRDKDRNKKRPSDQPGKMGGDKVPGQQEFGREQGSDVPEYLRNQPGQEESGAMGGDTSGMSGEPNAQPERETF